MSSRQHRHHRRDRSAEIELQRSKCSSALRRGTNKASDVFAAHILGGRISEATEVFVRDIVHHRGSLQDLALLNLLTDFQPLMILNLRSDPHLALFLKITAFLKRAIPAANRQAQQFDRKNPAPVSESEPNPYFEWLFRHRDATTFQFYSRNTQALWQSILASEFQSQPFFKTARWASRVSYVADDLNASFRVFAGLSIQRSPVPSLGECLSDTSPFHELAARFLGNTFLLVKDSPRTGRPKVVEWPSVPLHIRQLIEFMRQKMQHPFEGQPSTHVYMAPELRYGWNEVDGLPESSLTSGMWRTSEIEAALLVSEDAVQTQDELIESLRSLARQNYGSALLRTAGLEEFRATLVAAGALEQKAIVELRALAVQSENYEFVGLLTD